MRNDYQQTAAELKEELALIETKAKGVSTRLEALAREAESSKVACLQQLLEAKVEAKARCRGMVSLIGDTKRLRDSLLLSAGKAALRGFITKDKFAALHTGLSSLNSDLQGLGHAKWAVSLGKRIAVARSEEITSEGEWITWESLKVAMWKVTNRALNGEVLGDLDSVIHKLKQETKVLVFVALLVPRPSALKQS